MRRSLQTKDQQTQSRGIGAGFLVVCVACAAVAVRQVVVLYVGRQPCGSEGRSAYHRRVQPLRDALQGLPTAGYVGDDVAGYGDLTHDTATGLFWAQHHALPTILRRTGDDPVVVVNFHGADAAAKAHATGWRVERDFGNGLYVMRR